MTLSTPTVKPGAGVGGREPTREPGESSLPHIQNINFETGVTPTADKLVSHYSPVGRDRTQDEDEYENSWGRIE